MSESESRFSFIDEALASRKASDRYRRLTSYRSADSTAELKTSDGELLVDFSSNDYLGLSRHPEIVQRVCDYAARYGAGSGASRLITGTRDIHQKLEDKLAESYNREAALLFNSGFQANSTIIGTLTDRNSLVLTDKLSHNSLIQGSLLSRADFKRFSHNDLENLEKLLQQAQEQAYNRVLVITETIFSMDGDRAPVQEIAELTRAYDALLFVDDAHAAGVWGPKGLGLASDIPGVDVLLGTCGKAFGAFGAYIVCSQKVRNYLVNFCPGFIYTTALPPAVVGAIDAALDIIPTLDAERRQYHQRITEVRQAIRDVGFDTGPSSTQIIPIIVGEEQKALDLASWLESNGILAMAIRPPTVPAQSSRIRISLSMKHTDEHIEQFLTALKSWKRG